MTIVMPRRSATPSSPPSTSRRPPPPKVASTSSSMLFGKPLTLCQLVRLRSSDAEAELGEVGQEDVGQVDHDARRRCAG